MRAAPFYVYEFAARSGYAVPVAVLERLREAAPNFAGLKVSDTPWERFAPYLVEGLDVFVGPESLIPQGLAAGAVGAVSGARVGVPRAGRRGRSRSDGRAATSARCGRRSSGSRSSRR